MPDDTPPAGGEPAFTPPATQADFDRMVGERLARERSKFADYEQLKEKASKFDELDAQSKSELQKAQDALAEKDKQLASIPEEARRQALRFASFASQRGFLDPEDALAFIGNVDLDNDAAVTAALDDLAERKPHLVRIKSPKPPARPKPKGTAEDGESSDEGLEGKERAAAALRQMRNTR